MKRLPILYKNFLIVVCFLLASCGHKDLPNDPKLAAAMQMAGSNREELEKALDHYSTDDDSLKYKAAIFLIKYMPGKHAKVFSAYDSYKPAFDTLESMNLNYEKRGPDRSHNYEFYKYYKGTAFNYFMNKHHVKKTSGLDFEIKQDIETITAAYLIENIDYAFKAWQMPWNKTLSFADFCEYILPYRYGYEELQPWRKVFYENNKHLLNAFKNEHDPVKVGLFLKALRDTTRSEMAELRGFNNALRPLDLIRINTTISCKDESGVVLLRLRGLGVPITRLTIPNWANWNSGHDVNAILTLNKKWRPFAGGPDTLVYFPPSIFKTAKIFAEIYSDNANSGFISGTENDYKINPNYIDATGYVVGTTDVTLPFTAVKNGTQACISVFNNASWIPVAGATVNDGKATFTQIGKNVIYIAGVIAAGKQQLRGNPFLLDSNGAVKAIVPSKNYSTITLTRKYPRNELLDSFMPTLDGCYFQGSNDSTFANALTLWKIGKLTDLHTLEKALNNAKYQYIRLVFPDIERKNEELGGIQIYGKGNTGKTLLTGQPISSTKASDLFYGNVFDNNPLTFVRLLARKYADFTQFYNGESLVIPDKQPFWIGLKFKDKIEITALAFSPRTDDNDVNTGESYRLFYWNNGTWTSQRQGKALSNKITFNVPQKAVYVLKNTDKGNEQRLFLYQGNKQVWY